MRKMMSPQQLILGALLLSSSLLLCSSLAIVREDFGSNTTADLAALRSEVRSALGKVQAKMVKAGLKPHSAEWPDAFKPLTGQVWNCLQAVVETTDPIWSIGEGVAAFEDAECAKNSSNTKSKGCLEITMGLSEDSLGALAWVLDFPTNCLELTCGGDTDAAGNQEPKNPINRMVVMGSAGVDMLASLAGFANAHYARLNQCVDEEGDTLGDAFGKVWERYWHPGFSSFIPLVKEIREIWQISVAGSTEIPMGKKEKWLSLAEWFAGAAQNILEAEMDREGDKDTAAASKDSAKFGCAAMGMHIVGSIFAFMGSVAKYLACKAGEWEPYQVNTVRAANNAGNFAGNNNPTGGVGPLPAPRGFPVVPPGGGGGGGPPPPPPPMGAPVPAVIRPVPARPLPPLPVAPPPIGTEIVTGLAPSSPLAPLKPPPIMIPPREPIEPSESQSVDVAPVPPPMVRVLPENCPYDKVDWMQENLRSAMDDICDMFEHTFNKHTGVSDDEKCREECCGEVSQWKRKSKSRWCQAEMVNVPFHRVKSLPEIQEARQMIASSAASVSTQRRNEEAEKRSTLRRMKSKKKIIELQPNKMDDSD